MARNDDRGGEKKNLDRVTRPDRDTTQGFNEWRDPSRPAVGLGNISDTNYDPTVSGPDVRDDPDRRDMRGPARPPTDEERRRAKEKAERAFDPKVRGSES